jgi:site-specific DNA recombinase
MATQLIAALYSRTSHEKDDAFSIASQVKEGLARGSEHNIYVPDPYVFKEDFTGTVLNRPELNKVRRLMLQKKIDVLIIYDIDRLARKKYVGEYLLEEEIFRNGIQLFIARKNMFVRNTFSDRILFGIEGNGAQEEREKILERTDRGRKEKLAGSEDIPAAWLGQSPVDIYGYQKLGKKRNTHLTLVEAEAEIARLIFELFVIERWGVQEIVKHLNATGIATPSQAKGGMPWNIRTTWHHAMVYRILKQTAYTGVFYGFKTIEINGKTKRRPKEDWIRLEFPELQIIDTEIFAAAQELLAKGRAANAPKWTREYLLVRRLRCQCTYATRAKSSTKRDKFGTREYAYYVCYGKVEHVAQECPVPNIRADYVDAKAWESLEKLLKDPETQLRGLKDAQQLQRVHHHEVLEDLEHIDQTRARYNQELDDLYQDYKDGLITKHIYLKRKHPLDERLRAAEEVYAEYSEQLEQHVLSDSDIIGIAKELRKLHEMLEKLGTLEYAHKRKLIELMNITGQFVIEEGEHILYLKIHEVNFDRIRLGLVPQTA